MRELLHASLSPAGTYLVEARSAGASQDMQWLPFPVRDFSSRAVVVRDTGTAPGAAQFCVIALDPSHVERPLISELGLPLTKLPFSSMRCASAAQGLTKEHQLKNNAHLMRDE